MIHNIDDKHDDHVHRYNTPRASYTEAATLPVRFALAVQHSDVQAASTAQFSLLSDC